MSSQKSVLGRRPWLNLTLLLIFVLLIVPAFILAGIDGDPAYDEHSYLPIVLNEANGTRTATPTPTPCPYGPHIIPDNGTLTVQMEDFTCGGQGIAFSELPDSGGPGSGIYRSDAGDEGPDLQETSDTGGGYNLGWTRVGEWLEYEVESPTTTMHTLTIRHAEPDDRSPRMQITITSADDPGLQYDTGFISLPTTGGWQIWADYNIPVDFFAGTNILRITFDEDGTNYNYFKIGPLLPTATPTNTATPTPSNTPTSTPTSTPSEPYIILDPDCGTPDPAGEVQFRILGYNWPTDEAYTLFWEGSPKVTVQAGHTGVFLFVWTFTDLEDGSYEVRAESGSGNDISIQYFEVPCEGAVTPTPTTTPIPADLLIVGPPVLISEPPIEAYEPVKFAVNIQNSGEMDVTNQFFVDIFLDPGTVLTDRIPLDESSGYTAVSGLIGGASKSITVTAPLGFANSPSTHQIYAMVDSVQQIVESIETNNVSSALTVPDVTPGTPPTSTPTPGGGVYEISGDVRVQTDGFVLQPRAPVKLIDESTSAVVGTTITDNTGRYLFNNVAPGSYTVSACITIDGIDYYGLRTGINTPNPYADIFMIEGYCP